MKKGENRIQTYYDMMMHFAKLVNAMRRAQKRVNLYDLYDKPLQKEEAQKAANQYEMSVDYMLDRILG